MKIVKQFHLVLGLVLILIVGCVSSGQRLETGKVDQIKKGVTTRTEVEALFGQPDRVTIVGNGKKIMNYQYFESNVKGSTFIPYAGAFIGGSKNHYQNLQIMLKEDGVVEDFELSDKKSETEGGAFNRHEVPAK